MTHLFLETGKKTTSEYVFIDTLLKVLNSRDKVIIETVDGKDNLANAKNIFYTNTLEGGNNIIIFDADSPQKSGGFDDRRRDILNILASHSISADLFLFPNNHEDGCFEDLLLKIANKEKYNQFFDCFSDYEKCLGDNYEHPNLKGKVFTYISSMKSLSKTQRDNLGKGAWLFDNPDFWDIKSKELIPLIDFLNKTVK